MVGWAMHASHSARPKDPAHRVVNRIGLLTGKNHFSHPKEMERCLKAEGIRVRADKVVDFNGIFWDPAEHLSL